MLVPVAVSGNAEASEFRRLAGAASGLVCDAPEVMEELLVSGNAKEGQGGLAVDGGELGGLGGVPARVGREFGAARRGQGDAGVGGEGRKSGQVQRVRVDCGSGGGDGQRGPNVQRRRSAGDVGLCAGIVRVKEAAVVAKDHGLPVEGVDGAAEPSLEVAVPPEGFFDFDKWDGCARVGEGAALAVGGAVGFHCGTGGLHGAVAGSYCWVSTVVVADEEEGGLSGDCGGGWRAMSARGVIAWFVGHSEGEFGGQGGRLRGDADVGVADGSGVALVASNAPRGFGGNGALMYAHGLEGVDQGVFFGFRAAVSHESVGADSKANPSQVQEGKRVGAIHGADEAALAKVVVEANDVDDLGQVGAELERVEGDDPVKGERAGRNGAAQAAG